MTDAGAETGRATKRLPRGPHRLDPDDVAANQRERLVGAMVELVGANGYTGTPVADVIERAGVSRKTFYELFPNREELLKAAFESSSNAFLEALESSPEDPRRAAQPLEALMRGLCERADRQPGIVSLWSVEIGAAQAEGFRLREGLMDRCAKLIEDGLQREGKQRMPHVLSTTLAGAVHREIDARMRDTRGDGARDLSEALTSWTRSYHPVPTRLKIESKSSTSWPGLTPDGRLGGRAPGTLTLGSEGYLSRIGKSSGLRDHVDRERILDAVAQLAAAGGYGAVNAEGIMEHTGVGERVFRAHFKNAEEAFLAALELGHTKAQAIVERIRSRGGSWPESVAEAIAALFEFFASEPHFARLAFVEAPLARPATARRTLEHATVYTRIIFENAPQRRKPPPVAAEAITHGLFELIYCHAEKEIVGELPSAGPEAVYLALAPFVGVTEAGKVASRSG